MMIRDVTGIGALALVLMLGPGCEPRLPTAPSQILSGIVVYVDVNFLGRSGHITKDISDLGDFAGPCDHFSFNPDDRGTRYNWNDCISSVRVAPGWRATLYRDDGYRDDSIEITADMPDLRLAPHDCPEGGLNDCVTSVRVRRQ